MTAVVFWGLIAIVVLAPLPYGAVHLWSYSLLSLLTGTVLAVWAVAAARRPGACPVEARRYAVPAALFAGVLVWVGLQACPFVPVSWHHPLWADARSALGATAVGSISLDADETLLVLMRMATFGSVFWLSMQLCRDPGRATVALWAIAIAGLAYAAYGIAVEATASGTILFSRKWAYVDALTSTLVNRNHYAVYAGLGLIVSFGLLIHEARRRGRGAFQSPARLLGSFETLGLAVFLLGASCMVIATALLLTQSRGGVAFTCIAVLFLVLLLGAGRNMGRRSTVAIVAAVSVGGGLLLAFTGEGVVVRLLTTPPSADRWTIQALTLEMIAAAPWTGHGAGTFAQLFQIFRGPDFAAISPTYTEAHSVYLEMVAEIGIVAGVAYFSAIVWLAAACVIGSRRRRRDAIVPAIAGSASLLIGLHSAIDFSAQIPGVAVTFAALLGIGFAQSWSSEER